MLLILIASGKFSFLTKSPLMYLTSFGKLGLSSKANALILNLLARSLLIK